MNKFLIIILLLSSLQMMAQPPAEPPLPPPPPPSGDIESNEPLLFAEQMPFYPGGDSQMQSDIMRNAIYPKEEYEKKINCSVYVSFIVEKDGSVSDVKAVRTSPNIPAFSEAAVEAVRNLRSFFPGKQNGKTVRIQLLVPVKFTVN